MFWKSTCTTIDIRCRSTNIIYTGGVPLLLHTRKVLISLYSTVLYNVLCIGKVRYHFILEKYQHNYTVCYIMAE